MVGQETLAHGELIPMKSSCRRALSFILFVCLFILGILFVGLVGLFVYKENPAHGELIGLKSSWRRAFSFILLFCLFIHFGYFVCWFDWFVHL